MIDTLPYLLVLFAYFCFFIIAVIAKTSSPFFDKIIFCAVCFAWFGVLVYALSFKIADFSFQFPNPLIAMMLGMSLTGIAYSIRDVTRINFFLIMIVLTMIGEFILIKFLV